MLKSLNPPLVMYSPKIPYWNANQGATAKENQEGSTN